MNFAQTLLSAARQLTRLGRPPKAPNRDTSYLFQLWNAGNVAKAKPVRKRNAKVLRNLSDHPVMRRAINSIKNPICSMKWYVKPAEGASIENEETRNRILIATKLLKYPNAADSFRTLVEQILEDMLVIGGGSIETQVGGDPYRPVFLWPVDSATIEIDPTWNGDPRARRFRQDLGFMKKKVDLADMNLMYLRPNPRTYSPFGYGPVEFAFDLINDFLNSYDQANKLASDIIPGWILDLGEGATPDEVETMRLYFRTMIEGQGRNPIIGGKKGANILKTVKGDDSDLRITWQKFLILLIAQAFDLNPMKLGLNETSNRSTAEQQAETDDLTAIKPWAELLAETITRHVFVKILGWTDIEFCWYDLEKAEEESEARTDKMYHDMDVYTPDQIRARKNMPPHASGIGRLTKTERNILIAQARGTKTVTEIPGEDLEEEKPNVDPMKEGVY